MTKHTFPVYAFCIQKKYLYRHLGKSRSMKVHSFINRLQDLNPYLEEFLPDTEDQEIIPVPADEIIAIISAFYSQRND